MSYADYESDYEREALVHGSDRPRFRRAFER
jgi:hypothetical protein